MPEENLHFKLLHNIDAVLAAGFRVEQAQFKQNLYKVKFHDGTIVEYGIFTEFMMGKCIVTSEVMVNNIHIGSRPVGANIAEFYSFLRDYSIQQKEDNEKAKQDTTFSWIDDLRATEDETPLKEV